MDSLIWFLCAFFGFSGCFSFLLGVILLCYPPLLHWISLLKCLDRRHSLIFFALTPLLFYLANACVPEGFP